MSWNYNSKIYRLGKKHTHIEKKLYQSQKKYIEIQQKQDDLQNDILRIETQVKVSNCIYKAKNIEIQRI